MRSIFRSDGQSDAEFLKTLQDLDRDDLSRAVTKKSEKAILFHGALINPTSWDADELVTRVLSYVVDGLTGVGQSDVITPSVFNTDPLINSISRLPTIDELYLRNLYANLRHPHGYGIASGLPLKQGLDRLTVAISFDLLD